MSKSSIIRPARIVAMLAAGALALTACGGGQEKPGTSSGDSGGSSDSGGGTTITAAIGYDGDNFDPASTTSAVSLAANWHTMEGLTELDPVTREVHAALASDLPTQVSDTEWEATLRDGAKFSDGSDVTAEDVVNAFNLTLEGFYAPMLEFVDKVEAKDDTTVTITTKFPFSLVPERVSLVKVFPASQSEDERASKPIGTGPYIMTSAIKSKEVVFEKNPNYNGPREAKADNMHWDILVDDTARVTAMTQGSVMAIDKVPAVSKATLEGKAEMESIQSFGLDFIMFNTKKAPFDDARVRQAFLYAIDTEALIDKALGGDGSPATSFLQEDHPNYHEAAVVYTHDVEKAKELLAEAGVSNLNITLNTTDHGNIQAIAPLIQQNLKDIGVEANIETAASAAMYSNVTDVDNPDFDVVIAPGDPSVFGNDPDLLMSWWYGDNPWTEKRTQWKDSDGYNQLHEKMDEAVRATGDEQQAAWNDCFDILSEQVPLYPLYHKKVTTAWNAEQLDGFQPISLTGMSFLDVAVK